jgi:signal transduction histidine kinase
LSEGSADRGLTERLRAERDERRRLAELIHDGPVQHVAAIAQMLDAAHHAMVDGDDEMGRRIVARALEIAREASADLREIVSGIEPDALRELGLAGAVRELAERFSVRRGLEIELDVDGPAELGEGAQSGLYQVVREALDQAVRRGPPSRISISLRDTADGVELRVADDGGQERRQAVLDGLTQRAVELNGSFASETTDAGTWIAVRLPPSAAHL